jgi:serine protease DegQ
MDSADLDTNDQLLGLSRRLAEAVERAGARVVALDARPRVRTSGVIWRPGLIVSTDHTVKRDEEITVTFDDGRQAKTSIVGRDPATDLVLLRLQDQKEAAAEAFTPFADGATLKPGNLVLAVGRAHPAQGVSASLGILSVVSDNWRTWRGAEIDRLIRPDVSIFVGFSGGALVGVEGRIIGINTTGLSRGAGVTIPASTVDRVVDQLLAGGRVGRPYLGVGMHPVLLPGKMGERIGFSQPAGLIMLSVDADGPADKAGLTIGDVMLALGGNPSTDTDEVQAILGSQQVGTVIKATFLRGGEIKEVEITLGERPVRKG